MTHAIIIALYFRLNIRSISATKINLIFVCGKKWSKKYSSFSVFLAIQQREVSIFLLLDWGKTNQSSLKG
jgi:hypothetical protein